MPEVEDLDAPPDLDQDRRPTSRGLKVAAIVAVVAVLTIAVGVARSRQADARDRRAETQLQVGILGAAPVAATATDVPGELDARVTLTLSATVPVSVVSGEIDNAPPLSTGDSTGRTRTPKLTINWRIRCAEVGTLEGPRLLVLDVSGRYAMHDVRLRVSTADTDPTARAFRLAASNACAG